MTPLIDFAALQSLLSLALLVPAAVLGLIVFRAVLIARADAKAEAFHERCQQIDVTDWHDRRAA